MIQKEQPSKQAQITQQDGDININQQLEQQILELQLPKVNTRFTSKGNQQIDKRVLQYLQQLIQKSQNQDTQLPIQSTSENQNEDTQQYQQKTISISVKTKDGTKFQITISNYMLCQQLYNKIKANISIVDEKNKLSLFHEGIKMQNEVKIAKYTKDAQSSTIFALLHLIDPVARQTAFIHQQKQISDQFLMIVMSASQSIPKRDSIIYELMALIGLKDMPIPQIQQQESKQQQEKLKDFQIKSHLFEGSQPVAQIKQIFKIFKDDLFRGCIFSYTTPIFYSKLNSLLSNQQYTQVSNYLAAIIQYLPKQMKMAHRDPKIPLYRGIPGQYLDINTYKLYQHYYWTSFTSTSLNRKIAQKFAKKDGIIFKILVAPNKPYTNIKLPPDWSNAPQQEQVLIFPNFCFSVISKSKSRDGQFQQVTLSEVPYQNYLDYNQYNFPRIVWLDKQIFNRVNVFHQRDLKKKFINIIFCREQEIGQKELSTCKDALLIISGSLGQEFIPKIHNMQSLKGVAIYCLSTHFHKKWSSKFKKVGIVTNSIGRLIAWVEKKQGQLRELNKGAQQEVAQIDEQC